MANESVPSLTANFDLIPFRPLINVGCLFDIITGVYVRGKYGESILNGGLGMLTGIAGIGNNFKTTILEFLLLSGLNRITATIKSSLFLYDTEINVVSDARLMEFASAFFYLKDRDLTDSGELVITSKINYSGNKWFELFKEYLDNKVKNTKHFERDTPFIAKDGKTQIRMLTPTFGAIDSLSDFTTDDVAKIQGENELGDSGGNTQHMRQGLAKTSMLMQLPAMCGRANHYLGITAQLGKDIAMASGPMPAPPIKKLQFLKNNDKLKGVTDKFYFLMSNCMHAYNAAPLVTKDRTPEYPKEGENENTAIGTDLNIVTLRQLRSKTGPSGITLEIIVSQNEGVLPGLTEFHYIKSNERFGISGTLQHYALDLYPDVKLQRTTVRTRIEQDVKLQRALNITAELLQITQYWTHFSPELLISPKQIYDRLKELGYDWDVLLNTRGWWTFDNDKTEVPFLSTMDLLNMCKKQNPYIPYWLPKDVVNKVKENVGK